MLRNTLPASVSPTSPRHTHPVPAPGLLGAHERDHPSVLLPGAAPGSAASGHAGRDCGHRQVGAGGSDAGQPGRRGIPGEKRAVQLLHHVGDAAGSVLPNTSLNRVNRSRCSLLTKSITYLQMVSIEEIGAFNQNAGNLRRWWPQRPPKTISQDSAQP